MSIFRVDSPTGTSPSWHSPKLPDCQHFERKKHLSVLDVRASLPSYFEKNLPTKFQRDLQQEQKSSSVPDSLPFIPQHAKQKLNVSKFRS